VGGAGSRDHLASLHAKSRKKKKKERQSLPSALNTLSSLSHSSLLRSPCNAGASAKKASTTTPSPPKKNNRRGTHTTLKTYVILTCRLGCFVREKVCHSLSFSLCATTTTIPFYSFPLPLRSILHTPAAAAAALYGLRNKSPDYPVLSRSQIHCATRLGEKTNQQTFIPPVYLSRAITNRIDQGAVRVFLWSIGPVLPLLLCWAGSREREAGRPPAWAIITSTSPRVFFISALLSSLEGGAAAGRPLCASASTIIGAVI
jgi:hypothetical protein